MTVDTLTWWLLGWVAIAIVGGIAWSLIPREDEPGEDLSPCPDGKHNTLCGVCRVCACNPEACPDCWGCHTPGCIGHCVGHEVTA